MITGYKSIQTLFAQLYRDLGTNAELNESDIIEWSAEALAMIGAYGQYEEISNCLTLVNGKAKLPCGFDKLVDISFKGHPIYWATNTNASNYQCHNCRVPACIDTNCKYTFYINDSYIITNINDEDNQEANLCMVYLGIKTDDEGYPMIPDDVYYFKALTSYVIHKLDYQEWRKGKITDKVMDKSEKEWLFYVNSARGAANMPNTAQLERLKNVMRRLMPITNDYKTGFKNFNKGENLNIK